MSYDLSLRRVPDDTDPLTYWRTVLRDDSDVREAASTPPGHDADDRKLALCEALQSLDTNLKPFDFQFPQIAQHLGITEEDARRRYRHIELNGPQDGPGIQITLFDDEVSVTVPYWHSGARARNVWVVIWTYLRLLHDIGGMSVYDPQLDKVVDLDRDLPVVVKSYLSGLQYTESLFPLPRADKCRPWWRFW